MKVRPSGKDVEARRYLNYLSIKGSYNFILLTLIYQKSSDALKIAKGACLRSVGCTLSFKYSTVDQLFFNQLSKTLYRTEKYDTVFTYHRYHLFLLAEACRVQTVKKPALKA